MSRHATYAAYGCSPGMPNPFALGWYPLAFQVDDGSVFVCGQSDVEDCAEDPDDSSLFESRKLVFGVPPALPAWENLPDIPPPAALSGGIAVMYQRNQILKVGRTDLSASNRKASKIDLNADEPTWTALAPMPTCRESFHLVVLPSGGILANGGVHVVDGGVLGPDLYNPYTNQWTHLADMPGPSPQERGYHSSALLLPNGSVFTAGGQECDFENSPSTCADQWTYQIFQPPYFFDQNGDLAVRPAIDSCASASTIFYGGRFSVTLATPDAHDITRVRLIRPGSMTHSFDHSQRSMELNFCAEPGSATKLTVDAPDTGNDAPPGYYMLFVATGLNGALPSVAHWVRVIQGGAAGATVVSANPPIESPWVPGQPFLARASF